MEDLNRYESIKYRIESTVQRVRDVLHDNRNLVLPSEVPHSYGDKFQLAESMTNCVLARCLSALEHLGLSEDKFKDVSSFVVDKQLAIKLRATITDSCEFVKETTESVDSKTSIVQTVKGALGSSTKETKIVQQVTTYHWRMKQIFSVQVQAGHLGSGGTVDLLSRSFEMDLTSQTKVNPRAQQIGNPVKDHETDITFLFKHLEGSSAKFSIDRNADDCHTPGYNQDVSDCMLFMNGLKTWTSNAFNNFVFDIFPLELTRSEVNMTAVVNCEQIFVPVAPVMEKPIGGADGLHVNMADFGKLTQSFVDSIKNCVGRIPLNLKVDSKAYGQVAVYLQHLLKNCDDYLNSISYIRGLIAKQVSDAIGKVVTAKDLNEFSAFHNSKIFNTAFCPKPMCHDVRRSGYTPEGMFTIDFDYGNDSSNIVTIQRSVKNPAPFKLALSASNNVMLRGSQYVHGYVAHQFSTESSPVYKLIARARQFSSFIMLVGTIGSGNSFVCKDVILIQNKDELVIPLLFETIPSAGEFKDAISSLSPEQQRFAKAFREMQMASTVFAVAIIQIKPQLEKVLKLPEDALTKQIKLTQDLMELFTEYQIPSDLLSYAGTESASVEVKTEAVRKNVEAVKQIIEASKQQEIDERNRLAALEKAEAEARIRPAPQSFGFSGQTMGFGAAPSPAPMVFAKSAMMPMVQMAPNPCPPPCAAPQPAPSAPFQPAPGLSPPTATMTFDDMPAKAEARSVPEDVSIIDMAEATNDHDAAGSVDFLAIPSHIESNFEKHDPECNLRPTKIKSGPSWRLWTTGSLLGKKKLIDISTTEDKNGRKNKAMDLLDALTRSGELHVEDSSVHVVFAVTHCFDRTVFDTVCCQNINPIERMERSVLVMAKTIHDVSIGELVKTRERARIQEFSPTLFQ